MDEYKKDEILITGHLNPDTDSICAAIAYADLKSKTAKGDFVACRAGKVSAETGWVLKRFGLEAPRLLTDVSPQLGDMEIRRVRGIARDLSVRGAWTIMHNNDISTLPIVDDERRLLGLISLKDLALGFMDSFSSHALIVSDTSFRSIASTLKGDVITGDPDGVMKGGRIHVAAGDTEMIKEVIKQGDLVITSNREDAQRAAIEGGARCVVVTTFADISDEVKALAAMRGCVLISTSYDTYKTAYYINQSVPIGHYMTDEAFTSFTLETSVEEVLNVMSRTRHSYFPVLDGDGKYYGLVSKRNMLSRRRKRLILVDHNERSQCVSGWEDADIEEIVDHHRVGGIQTISPIFFRNQPLGSTCTIISQMYGESGVPIPENIAGAMLCAILSDTLAFRSPTCTPTDREAAAELARIAGVDVDATAREMFEAGEELADTSAEELLHRDYKIFSSYDTRIGVSQSMFFSPHAMTEAMALAEEAISSVRAHDDVRYYYYLLTDIEDRSSLVLCAGDGSEELLREAFSLPEGASLRLPGVVSRKKQFLPAIIEALRRRAEE